MTDIEYETVDGVAVITVNRPDRGNSFTFEMLTELLPAAWRRAEEDGAVGAIVLTATGDRFFCTGVDTRDSAIVQMTLGERAPVPIRMAARQNGVTKPVIAAINGSCSGGGLMLAADCDIALASSAASFTNHGPSLGVAANIGAAIWAASGRLPWALRLSLLGARGALTADDAIRYGAVGEIVDAGGLRSRAIELGTAIAANSPSVVRSTKATLWQAATLRVEEAMALAEEEAVGFAGHPDALEARRALMEGRSPVWQVTSSSATPGGSA